MSKKVFPDIITGLPPQPEPEEPKTSKDFARELLFPPERKRRRRWFSWRGFNRKR